MTKNRDRNTQKSGSCGRGRWVDAVPKQPWIEEDAEAVLGRKLANVYSELVEQPVPDRFKDLLNQLRKDSERE